MKRGKTRISGKNLLFAELIIVTLFFSIASAGCVLLFAEAYSDGKQSRDLTNAVIMAQNTAEIFKATGDIHAASSEGLWQSTELSENNGISELRITVLRDTEVVYELIVAKAGVIP
jgi:DNA-binding Xre family transcriptional regulator